MQIPAATTHRRAPPKSRTSPRVDPPCAASPSRPNRRPGTPSSGGGAGAVRGHLYAHRAARFADALFEPRPPRPNHTPTHSGARRRPARARPSVRRCVRVLRHRAVSVSVAVSAGQPPPTTGTTSRPVFAGPAYATAAPPGFVLFWFSGPPAPTPDGISLMFMLMHDGWMDGWGAAGPVRWILKIALVNFNWCAVDGACLATTHGVNIYGACARRNIWPPVWWLRSFLIT